MTIETIITEMNNYKNQKASAEWWQNELIISVSGKEVKKVKCQKPISGHYLPNGEKVEYPKNIELMDNGDRFLTIGKEDSGSFNIVFHNNF